LQSRARLSRSIEEAPKVKMTVVPRLVCVFAAIVATVALAACTQPRPTAYRAAEGGFGYSETRLENGNWQVEFTGNPMSPLATMENYALYRSAEITLREGFGEFAVMDRDVGRQETRTQDFAMRPPGIETMEQRHDATLQPADSFVGKGTVRTVTNSAILIIRPYKGVRPAGAQQVYSATEVLSRLGPEIRRMR